METYKDSDLWGSAINFLILAYALLEDDEKSMGWIEESFSSHQPMSLLLFTEPILKPLRQNSRFLELRRNVLGEESTWHLPVRKYKKALLDEQQIQRYTEKITSFMSENQPFLNPELSLRDLADHLHIPHNQLSQLLNEGFGKNFSDFVNGYRLEVFKSKVSEPSLQHLTLLALAFESGFNSKTVFNTYFKKKMGMTPKAYWKEQVAS